MPNFNALADLHRLEMTPAQWGKRYRALRDVYILLTEQAELKLPKADGE